MPTISELYLIHLYYGTLLHKLKLTRRKLTLKSHIYCMIFVAVVETKVSHNMPLNGLEINRSEWPGTHGNPPALCMLGLKVCTTMHSSIPFSKWQNYRGRKWV